MLCIKTVTYIISISTVCIVFNNKIKTTMNLRHTPCLHVRVKFSLVE